MSASYAPGTDSCHERLCFSVAMCTCNGASYLEQQLESIAGQRLAPRELIVCDDASTDATISILESFAARSPFPVRLHRNPSRLGTTANFEKAIGLCSEDLVALADQDDIWMPEKLEVFHEIFASAPSVVAVCSDALLVDQDAHSLQCSLWECLRFEPPSAPPGTEFSVLAPQILLKRNVVTGATLAFRARLCSEIGPTRMPLIHDYSIALLAALQGDVALVSLPLVHYRQHAGQQIGAPLHRGRQGRRKPSVRERWLDKQRKESAMNQALSAALGSTGDTLGQAGAFRDEVQRHQAHLEFRLALPQDRARRIWMVTKALLTGRYRWGAKPFKAALRDVVLTPLEPGAEESPSGIGRRSMED